MNQKSSEKFYIPKEVLEGEDFQKSFEYVHVT